MSGVFCVYIGLDMAYFYKYQDLRYVFGGCEYNEVCANGLLYI